MSEMCVGGEQCGHGPGCEDWVTVHVFDLPADIWYVPSWDANDVAPVRHLVMQELRGITCIAKNETGGWLEEFKPPYRRRVVLAPEGLSQ